MKLKVIIFYRCLILFVINGVLVLSSPLPKDDVKRVISYQNQEMASKEELRNDHLKPVGSFSVLKTHAKIYTNINGREKEVAQTKEEVDKDGNVLAKVEQRIDKSGDNGEPRITTSLEIPSQNIHKVIHNKAGQGKVELNAKGPAGLQYSPADMADYIFWTGDEKGVTSAIEEYLQEGMMSRNDAIDFLQEIKKNLELIQNQFSDTGDLLNKVSK